MENKTNGSPIFIIILLFLAMYYFAGEKIRETNIPAAKLVNTGHISIDNVVVGIITIFSVLLMLLAVIFGLSKIINATKTKFKKTKK